MSNASQEYIKKINPEITDKQVKQINLSINKYAKVFSIDKELILAIIKAESTFYPKAISRTNDYGLMQMNIKTIRYLKFDVERIKSDIDYSILCGTFYLALLRRRYPKDKYWWARYHSSTPIHKDKYIEKIQKILRRNNNGT